MRETALRPLTDSIYTHVYSQDLDPRAMSVRATV